MEIIDILKHKKLKLTKGRVAILEILQLSAMIRADEILKKCREMGVEINQSTVYRALELFEKECIIEKFPLYDGIFAYQLKDAEHKHLLQCSICQRQVEISCPMKQRLEEVVMEETGFTLTEHNLIMKGICKECKNKGDK